MAGGGCARPRRPSVPSCLLMRCRARSRARAPSAPPRWFVDALDEAAAGFYAAHGFMRLPDSLRLIMPMRQAGAGAER
jgi:hypothetical protein